MRIAEYIQCSPANYTRGRQGRRPDAMAVHYTATGASAHNNLVYFSRPGAQASAHLFVDKDGTIRQSVGFDDTAWAVGNWARNLTTISVENVSAGEDFSAQQIAAMADIYQSLRATHGITDVIRHYDVTGKRCPAPYVDAGKWATLRAQIVGGAAPAPAPGPAPAPVPGSRVAMHYCLRVNGGGWLADVTDFGGGDDGFAGLPCHGHDLLAAWVDRGSLRYRAHAKGLGWQGWIDHADKGDTVSGCAGVPGRDIDGAQMYYTTPAGETLQQVWYRSQTVARAGWLGVCCDDGTSVGGYDGWAGMLGEGMDRLQCAIAASNPF